MSKNKNKSSRSDQLTEPRASFNMGRNSGGSINEHGGSRKNSADMTRQLLRKREEEIDRRVADLKARLNTDSSNSTLKPLKIQRNASVSSQASEDSAYDVNRSGSKSGLNKVGRFGNRDFSDAERGSSAAAGSHSDPGLRSMQKTGSQYPTNRRISSIKKPSFVPTPKPKKHKESWFSWFCPCQPGRKNAAQQAQAANSRYERQRLLEEEGRLAYNSYGANGGDIHTPNNSYSQNPQPYAYNPSPRSSRARNTPQLTPVSKRNSNASATRY